MPRPKTTKRPAARKAKTPKSKPPRSGRLKQAAQRPKGKVFSNRSLFGALPGMSAWAFPLLKELRDE
ncbi:MAG: hypothetical protein IPJ87_04665 [Flavobacteriales bacterium]|jgi:hypothetical protein|nr:hypothetical protein [Flavobacteriales bacterium]MBK7941156.1 hypothetical protein [Flavobacteriales bacterium]MBK9701182.1 hypothetical protein [Flavobacteriales bacterium]